MTADTPALTTTELVAAASEFLTNAGFRRFEDFDQAAWSSTSPRIFEDAYSVAAVVPFETWKELADQWLDAQAALAELISEHIGRGEAKAWEGYLVLLTPSALSADARRKADDIRRDTTYVRKLVGTGEELRRGPDVVDILLPLLPLEVTEAASGSQEALDLLPDLLARRDVSKEAVRVIVEAFREQQPLVESLYRSLQPDGGSK